MDADCFSVRELLFVDADCFSVGEGGVSGDAGKMQILELTVSVDADCFHVDADCFHKKKDMELLPRPYYNIYTTQSYFRSSGISFLAFLWKYFRASMLNT